jgi:cellobiose-specific phosphotransferase system component IIC
MPNKKRMPYYEQLNRAHMDLTWFGAFCVVVQALQFKNIGEVLHWRVNPWHPFVWVVSTLSLTVITLYGCIGSKLEKELTMADLKEAFTWTTY